MIERASTRAGWKDGRIGPDLARMLLHEGLAVILHGCPRCEVEPGDGCVSVTGKLTRPHAARCRLVTDDAILRAINAADERAGNRSGLTVPAALAEILDADLDRLDQLGLTRCGPLLRVMHRTASTSRQQDQPVGLVTGATLRWMIGSVNKSEPTVTAWTRLLVEHGFLVLWEPQSGGAARGRQFLVVALASERTAKRAAVRKYVREAGCQQTHEGEAS